MSNKLIGAKARLTRCDASIVDTGRMLGVQKKKRADIKSRKKNAKKSNKRTLRQEYAKVDLLVEGLEETMVTLNTNLIDIGYELEELNALEAVRKVEDEAIKKEKETATAATAARRSIAVAAALEELEDSSDSETVESST